MSLRSGKLFLTLLTVHLRRYFVETDKSLGFASLDHFYECYFLQYSFIFEWVQVAFIKLKRNKNINTAAAFLQPIRKNELIFYFMDIERSYYTLIDSPKAGSCTEPVFFNGQSNYNSCFRQAEPHCTT
jgi:hypothetical protein